MIIIVRETKSIMCRGHHACLSSWESRVQSLVEPLLKLLKIIEEKGYLYIDISKWLDFRGFRLFAEKDVKIVGTSDPL